MATRRRKTAPKNADSDETLDAYQDPPIDTSEVLPEEVPAELLSWLEGLHPTICFLSTQYEISPKSWRMSRAKLTTQTPPEQTAHELAMWVIAELRRFHDLRDDPPQKYRAAAGIMFPGATSHVMRFTTLGATYDSDGSVQFVDLRSVETNERSARDIANHGFEQSSEIALRCLAAVAATTEQTLKIGTAVKDMAIGCAELAKNSGDGLARVIEAQGRIAFEQREHEADMERMRHLGEIGQQIAGPMAAAFAAYMARRPNGSDVRLGLHERFARLVDSAGQRWVSFCEALDVDERSMLSKLRHASSETEFLAIWKKLESAWDPSRLATVLPLIEQHLGQQIGQELAQLASEASARCRAAA